MARSRNIKPGFFRNAELVELPFETRLLFPGLWMLADRDGRLEDRPKQIKMEIFPADSVDVDQLLQQLHNAGLICRYIVDGKRFLQVLKFSKHQQPHHREPPSVIPECPDKTEESPGQAHGEAQPRSVPAALIPDVLIPDSRIYIAPNGPISQNAVRLDPIPYQKIVDLYHEHCPLMPKVVRLSESRRAQIRQRWKSGELPDLETWEKFFKFCSASKFLSGQATPGNGRKVFVANLEWITKEANFLKIWEKRYHEPV